MAVTPIKARCRRCRGDFHLFEVLDRRNGTCPRCGWSLTPDWTNLLLEDAARADIAQRHLVGALRSLRNLPGNLLVRPHTVMRNLFEEVGWDKDLAEDPDTLREELGELRQLLDTWELLDPVVAAELPRPGWIRRTIDWFKGRPGESMLAGAGPPPQPDEHDFDPMLPDGRDARVLTDAT